MLPKAVPLPTVESKLQAIPPSSFTGFRLEINNGFPRFQQASQEALTPPLHSDESRQISAHPEMPFAASNQTFVLNKTFILWMLIDSNKQLAAGGPLNPRTSTSIQEGAVSTWH